MLEIQAEPWIKKSYVCIMIIGYVVLIGNQFAQEFTCIVFNENPLQIFFSRNYRAEVERIGDWFKVQQNFKYQS